MAIADELKAPAQEGPPQIDFGIVERAEKERATAAERQMDEMVDLPEIVKLGTLKVELYPPTMAKIRRVKPELKTILQEAENLGKLFSSPEGETGNILGELMEKSEAVLDSVTNIVCILLTPMGQRIDLKIPSIPREDIEDNLTAAGFVALLTTAFRMLNPGAIKKNVKSAVERL